MSDDARAPRSRLAQRLFLLFVLVAVLPLALVAVLKVWDAVVDEDLDLSEYTLVGLCLEAAALLAADGIEATVWDPRVVKPLDPEMLDDVARFDHVVTVEDGLREGMRGAGLARARDFTWQKAARELLAQLRECGA